MTESADQAVQSSSAQSSKPTPQKSRSRKSGAEISLVTLGIIAAVSFGIATTGLLQESGSIFSREPYRGIVEIALGFFAIFSFLTVPFWSICLVICALRGSKRGYFSGPNVTRAESPAAFACTFILYIILAIGAILGVAYTLFIITAAN